MADWIHEWQTLLGATIGAIIVVSATYVLTLMGEGRERRRAGQSLLYELYGLKAFIEALRKSAVKDPPSPSLTSVPKQLL